jgi:23S rRNA (adenine2030-N6)-methyltransferase
MNYRHAFHAGNFADVLKHAVLVRILVHLCAKPAAFRVIDTHAGAGLYDLAGEAAARSPEWRDGIAKVTAAALDPSGRALLAPYLDAVAARNRGGRLTVYPGSPALARSLLRAQDRLVACELEPTAAAALARCLAGDRRCKALAIDGWIALKAYVPPPERRGVVLVDPPYEQPGEIARVAPALEAAHRKWASGIYLIWYPVKDRAAADALVRRLVRSGIPRILRVELSLAPARERLAACGLIVINPPWTLEAELRAIVPALAAVWSPDASWRVEPLSGEK